MHSAENSQEDLKEVQPSWREDLHTPLGVKIYKGVVKPCGIHGRMNNTMNAKKRAETPSRYFPIRGKCDSSVRWWCFP